MLEDNKSQRHCNALPLQDGKNGDRTQNIIYFGEITMKIIT
jgi:hypothetical protein